MLKISMINVTNHINLILTWCKLYLYTYCYSTDLWTNSIIYITMHNILRMKHIHDMGRATLTNVST